VGGLTTGGGFGRLARQYGLALDNVLSVDIVNGDGRLRHASAEENPELLWGVRGGGGNFGVVTSFEFKLHPMRRQVIGGTMVFPGTLARELLEVYAEQTVLAPDQFYADLVIVRPPDGGPGVALVDVCFTGSEQEAERLLKPYRAIGKPLQDGVAAVDYVALQRANDSSDPRAMASYMKAGFMSEFKPGLIDDLMAGLEPHPQRRSMIIFQQAGGAISRVPTDATAFPHRYATHNMMALVDWKPESPMQPHVDYIRRYWKTLAPYTHGFYTVDADDETSEVFNRNYQGNYPRLVALKNRYDPQNLFRLNANIRPTV
jgi:FAD/FMN-containing dehydrogenase